MVVQVVVVSVVIVSVVEVVAVLVKDVVVTLLVLEEEELVVVPVTLVVELVVLELVVLELVVVLEDVLQKAEMGFFNANTVQTDKEELEIDRQITWYNIAKKSHRIPSLGTKKKAVIGWRLFLGRILGPWKIKKAGKVKLKVGDLFLQMFRRILVTGSILRWRKILIEKCVA